MGLQDFLEAIWTYAIIKSKAKGGVRMRISTKGRYGLRVMIDLASHAGERYVPLREISERQNITVKYLEQIILPLAAADFLVGHRGYCGGYKLKVKPEEVTVGQILSVMEGSLAPVACLEPGADPCPRTETCQTLAMWRELDHKIHAYFNGIFLTELLGGSHEACALTAGTQPIKGKE